MASQSDIAAFLAGLREALPVPRKTDAYLEALAPFPATLLVMLRLKLVRAEIADLNYDVGPNPPQLALAARRLEAEINRESAGERLARSRAAAERERAEQEALIAGRAAGWEERQQARMAAFHAANREARQADPGQRPTHWDGKLPPSRLKREGEA